MSNTTIKIKRSTSNASPATLANGELAYSFVSGNLFIGNTTNAAIVIGGANLVSRIETLEAGGSIGPAYDQANAARSQANTAYDRANLSAQTARVYANSESLVIGGLNFVNTSTVNVSVTTSGDGNANISFTSSGSGSNVVLNDTYTDQGNISAAATANVANALYDFIVQSYDQANSAYEQANNSFQQANAAYSFASVTVYDQANAAYSRANTANTQANTARDQANAAYAQANSSYGQANASYGQANLAYTQANTAYGQANTANTQANLAYDQANTARTQANTAYGQANASYGQANLAYTQANTARDQANSAYGQANLAYTQANTANAQANLAYDQANTARTQANTAYGQANLAYTQANNAYGQANLAYTRANTANTQANLAYDQANTARTQANTAYDQANSAYGQANLAYTQANTSANSVWVYANGTSVLPKSNLNFNNTATVQVSATANGTTQSNIAFSVITTGADFASGANSTAQTAYSQANTAYTQANNAYDRANTANTQANLAYDQANSAYGQANLAYGQANGAYGQANLAYNAGNNAQIQADAARTQANSAYSAANNAANTVRVSANSGATLSSKQLNFVNTATVLVTVTDPTNGNANISFEAIAAAAPDGTARDIANAAANTVWVYANGTSVLPKANLNFNNTSTVTVSATANGTTQANIEFSVVIATSSVIGVTKLVDSISSTDTSNAATANSVKWAFESANSNALSAYAQANLAYSQANVANAQANTAYGQANSAYSRANTANGQANLAYDQANTARTQANNAYDQANLAYTQANTARDQANLAYAQANAARDQANTAYGQANLSYTQANTARDTANSAYGQANAAYSQANAAYSQANTARDTANSAYGQANLAYTQANTARDTANSAYGQANTAYGQANSAYAQANLAYAQANTANTQANTARDTANSAYTQANTARDQANTAYGQANLAYTQANNAYSQANSAANTVRVTANSGSDVTGNVNFVNTSTSIITVTSGGAGIANVQIEALTNSASIASLTGDVHGVVDRTAANIYFTDSTREYKIAPVSGSWTFYHKGVLHTISSNLTYTIANTSGARFMRIDPNTDTLVEGGPVPDFTNDTILSYIYFNNVTAQGLIVGDERHGYRRDTTWHSNQHLNVGTIWRSGGSLTYTTNDDAVISIGVGTPLLIADEDLLHTITNSASPTADYQQPLSPSANLEVLYLDGNGYYANTIPNTVPWVAGTSLARYNSVTGGLGSLVDASEGNYITYWLIATNDIRRPVKLVMGRASHANVDSALAEEFQEYGLSFAEQVFMYQIILKTSSAYSNNYPKVVISSVRKVTSKVAVSASTVTAASHGSLSGRDSADQHPIGAVTGLESELSTIYAQANDAYSRANTANTQANTARDTANSSYAQANLAYGQANSAYGQANLAYTQANTARDQANTARDTANSAYAQANTARDTANSAYGQANLAYAGANTANSQANTARDTANSAYAQSNLAYDRANTANTQANAARDQANSAYAQANLAYTTANSAYTTANSAYDQANSARTQANTARDTANSAYDGANSAANSVWVYANGASILSKANLNFNNTATVQVLASANGATQANITFSVITSGADWAVGANSTAQSAYTQANSAYDRANTANAQANTARDTANSAYSSANSAANSVWVYANGSSILSKSNINFNNTATVQVLAQANGTTQTNIQFTVLTTGADFASGANSTAQSAYTQANTARDTANSSYEKANSAANTVWIYANGTSVLSSANVNFNNTATVNVSATANGTGQVNVAFSVNTSAVSGGTTSFPVSSNTGSTVTASGINFSNSETTTISVTSGSAGNANVTINSTRNFNSNITLLSTGSNVVLNAASVGSSGIGKAESWAYTGKSYDIVAGGGYGSVTTIFVKPDGTKMWLLDSGSATDNLVQYTMTAWDISTAAIQTTLNVNSSGIDTIPQGFYFSNTGGTLFVLADTKNNVAQYTLGTAWDIGGTVTSSGNVSIAAQTSSPSGMCFSYDGKKLYVVSTSENVYQYDLSTSWDVTTAVYSSKTFNFTAYNTNISQLSINKDGTRFFFIGSTGTDSIYEFDLTTPYDISTAVYVSALPYWFTVGSTGEGSTQAFYVDYDQKVAYIAGNQSDIVRELSIVPGITIESNSVTIPGRTLFGNGVHVAGTTVSDSNMYVGGTLTVAGTGSHSFSGTIIGTLGTSRLQLGGSGSLGGNTPVSMNADVGNTSINLFSQATLANFTKTINIGTGGLSTSNTFITLGTFTGNSAANVYGNTINLNVTTVNTNNAILLSSGSDIRGLINTAGNTVRVSANSGSTQSNKQLNFINTSSVTVSVVDSGDGNANISFTSSAGPGGDPAAAYAAANAAANTVATFANGTVVLEKANLNFNNTATVQVAASANGTTQSNIAFSVITTGADFASGANSTAQTTFATINSTFGTVNTNISGANTYASGLAVAAANTVWVYANGTSILPQSNINFNNTATVQVAASANGTTQSNIAFSVITNGADFASGANSSAQTTFGTINTNISGANTYASGLANAAANSVWVYANGTSVLSKSNINFNNTATVQVSATANGTTQSNIAFTVLTTGADFASGANATAQSAYSAANSAANTVSVSANTLSTLTSVGLNFSNTHTINVSVGAGTSGNANVSFTVNVSKVIFVGTTAPASPAIGDLWVDTN